MKKNSFPPNSEDDLRFRQLMKMSARPMPFYHFEDDVMQAIAQAEAVQAQARVAPDLMAAQTKIPLKRKHDKHAPINLLRLSWFFFLIGLVSGIILLLMTPSYTIGFLGFQGREAWILIQGLCLIWLLMQAERLILFTKSFLKRASENQTGTQQGRSL